MTVVFFSAPSRDIWGFFIAQKKRVATNRPPFFSQKKYKITVANINKKIIGDVLGDVPSFPFFYFFLCLFI